MKSALFIQANVAVNTNLTSKVPFLFGNFHVFKIFGKKTGNFGMYDGKIFLPPPRSPTFMGKFF
jgi:hypothetical protein